MADLTIKEAYNVTTVSLDASATTFLTGDLLAGNGSGVWVKADADTAARQDCQWICLQSVSTGGSTTYTMPVAKRVVVEDTDAPYTAGALQFLSATPGLHTGTRPTIAAGTVQRVVGKAVSTTIAILNVDVIHYSHTFSFGANAQCVDTVLMVAERPLRVLEARESHITAGSDGGAVTLTVAKAASGTAITSGTNVLTTTFNMKSTASTPVAVGATTTAADARLATGDQLGADFGGTVTALVGVGLTVTLIDEQAI